MTPPAPTPGAGRRGDPTVAVFLTWILPGAGHVYLGRPLLGLAAFALLEGIYALGVQLSGGMFLEYLPPEMRGTFAGALTPEVGNLGALFLHIRNIGYGPGFPREWPTWMHLGTLLTACSGVLNLLLMARVHFDARRSNQSPRHVPTEPSATRGVIDPALACVAAWACPGLGHFLQGRRIRALFVFVALVGLFVLGSVLAEGSNLDRERHFYYWSGQFLLGGPTWVAEFLHAHARIEGPIDYVDAGVVLACVAGMLNVLVMLDVYSWSEERILGLGEAPATENEAEGATS
jgi:TM2 domain-containing membrane protein YozV